MTVVGSFVLFGPLIDPGLHVRYPIPIDHLKALMNFPPIMSRRHSININTSSVKVPRCLVGSLLICSPVSLSSPSLRTSLNGVAVVEGEQSLMQHAKDDAGTPMTATTLKQTPPMMVRVIFFTGG